MSKFLSKFACECNCERLACNRMVYLWTFTTADSPSPAECSLRWKQAVSQLTRKLGFFGVRVFEMHPGGHGMHVHLVTSKRFDVSAVRVITTRAGFGRIHVKSIPSCHASYIAKYLSKQRKSDSETTLPRGVRSWAIVGRSFFGEYTRVKDCQVKSPQKGVYNLLSTLYPTSPGLASLALGRVASLISHGLLVPLSPSLDGMGIIVSVCGAYELVLSPDNCWGLESDFEVEL